MRPVFESRRGHHIIPIGYEKEAKGLFFILANRIRSGLTMSPQVSGNLNTGKILKNKNYIPVLNRPKRKNLGQLEGDVPLDNSEAER